MLTVTARDANTQPWILEGLSPMEGVPYRWRNFLKGVRVMEANLREEQAKHDKNK